MIKNIVIPEEMLIKNPLIWAGQGNFVVKRDKRNIFLGVGIATPGQLSNNIPFDLIGFLLSAEFIKRQIERSKVFVLIADQHAWLANKMDKKQSKEKAINLFNIINKIIKSFNLQDWQVKLASNIFLKTIGQDLSYEILESRDVLHFFNTRDTGIKIGWCFSASENNHKTDESHFDGLNKVNISSLFIRPGETFSKEKPQESPYICTEPKLRVLLSSDENVTEKMAKIQVLTDKNRFRAVQNHLRRITILFEMLFGDFPPKTSVEKKVQSIIDIVFNK